MEEHVGTTVLATNRMADLDEAFTRRFHFIFDFPMPGPPERRRIWEGMMPRDAAREPAIDFDALARDYDISGGRDPQQRVERGFHCGGRGRTNPPAPFEARLAPRAAQNRPRLR